MKQTEMSLDTLVSFLIAIAITVWCMNLMDSVPNLGTWWWFAFVIINIVYMVTGMKSGRIKGDPANGIVVATGPVAFYFWTILGVWRKYSPWRNK